MRDVRKIVKLGEIVFKIRRLRNFLLLVWIISGQILGRKKAVLIILSFHRHFLGPKRHRHISLYSLIFADRPLCSRWRNLIFWNIIARLSKILALSRILQLQIFSKRVNSAD